MNRRIDLMELPSAQAQPPLMGMHCVPPAGQRPLMSADPDVQPPSAAEVAWLLVLIIGFVVVLSVHAP